MNFRALVAIVGIMLIAGCRVDFSSELYARDILGSDKLSFPALLEIEVPSCDVSSRTEYEKEILSVFSGSSEAAVTGCRNDALTSLLQVEFTGEVSSSDSSADLVMFRRQNDSGQTYVMPDLNNDFITRVNRVLEDNFQELTFESVKIAFQLHNDLDNTIEYFLPSGWVNGKPGQYISGQLERREKIFVRTPDIISELTLKGKQPIVLFLNEKE